MQHSLILLFHLNSDGLTSMCPPDVAGDLDSQTIEVLASWMLEHPLTEEQQTESSRLEGAPDTPSPDGPETVQCPERPTTQINERLGIRGRLLIWFRHDGVIVVSGMMFFYVICLQSVAGAGLDREGELFGCPPHEEQTSSCTAAALRPESEDLFQKSRSESQNITRNTHQNMR